MKFLTKLIVLSLFVSFFSCETESVNETNSQQELLRKGKGNDKDEVKDEGSCETAYAFAKEALCFIDDDELNSNKWGWTIGPIKAPYTSAFPLYQGAGQCNLDNGELIGTVYIKYIDDHLQIDYVTNDGYGLFETHLYVGSEKYPRKNNGQYTVAPGQYTYQNLSPEGSLQDTYEVFDLEGEIYVIAHAVVCPFEKSKDDNNDDVN